MHWTNWKLHIHCTSKAGARGFFSARKLSSPSRPQSAASTISSAPCKPTLAKRTVEAGEYLHKSSTGTHTAAQVPGQTHLQALHAGYAAPSPAQLRFPRQASFFSFSCLSLFSTPSLPPQPPPHNISTQTGFIPGRPLPSHTPTPRLPVAFSPSLWNLFWGLFTWIFSWILLRAACTSI